MSDVAAVVLGQRPTRQPHAGVELVVVVDASRGVVVVDLDHHADMLAVVREEQMLGLADIGHADCALVMRDDNELGMHQEPLQHSDEPVDV